MPHYSPTSSARLVRLELGLPALAVLAYCLTSSTLGPLASAQFTKTAQVRAPQPPNLAPLNIPQQSAAPRRAGHSAVAFAQPAADRVPDPITAGAPRLDFDFVWGRLSARPLRTGIGTALLGSVWLALLTALITVPLGVGAAIYLEEFAPAHARFARFVRLNVANLAGVPGIVYGLLGLAVFVRGLGMGASLLAGALTRRTTDRT